MKTEMKKQNVKADPRLIVALDTPSLDIVKKILKELEGAVSFYKVGFELFTAHGWEAVNLVRKSGAEVFLDLKLHDIPNTVSKAAAVLAERDIEIFNVHTLGGFEMMKKTREMVDLHVKDPKKRPLVIGVTILTSHNESDLKEMGIGRSLNEQVLHLAKLAKKAGLDGVVCSPQEIEMLRKEFPKDFVIVTPGVRPAGSAKGDQKRTMTPGEAIKAGASFIVVGRPITAAKNPRNEVLSILKDLN